MDFSIDRPSRFLQWAVNTFGPIALDPRERAMRFVEEAIELAHAADVDHITLQVIVKRVFARPPGTLAKEVGQSLATLELFAKAAGVNADDEAQEEFYRVQSIPKEEWERRHQAKVAIGMAL